MQIPTTVTAFAVGADAVATLNPMMFSAKLLGLTITGVNTRAEVYMGSQRIDSTTRGLSNTADYATPRDVPSGMPLSVRWIGAASNAATCSATFVIER